MPFHSCCLFASGRRPSFAHTVRSSCASGWLVSHREKHKQAWRITTSNHKLCWWPAPVLCTQRAPMLHIRRAGHAPRDRSLAPTLTHPSRVASSSVLSVQGNRRVSRDFDGLPPGIRGPPMRGIRRGNLSSPCPGLLDYFGPSTEVTVESAPRISTSVCTEFRSPHPEPSADNGTGSIKEPADAPYGGGSAEVLVSTGTMKSTRNPIGLVQGAIDPQTVLGEKSARSLAHSSFRNLWGPAKTRTIQRRIQYRHFK